MQQEGRGIGLVNKIRAYQLQDAGFDTYDANLPLGFEPDERDYEVSAAMLDKLGVQSVRLLTNNPDKVTQLERFSVKVLERVPLEVPPTGVRRILLEGEEGAVRAQAEAVNEGAHFSVASLKYGKNQ